MPLDTGDKTEAPTPRRLQEAREKGQVARSTDFSAAVCLLAGLILLNIYGAGIINGFMEVLRQSLTLDRLPANGTLALDESWRMLLRQLGAMLGPFLLVLTVAAVAANLLQVGFVFTTQSLMPSFDKLSPLAGLQRLFSRRTGMRLGMSLAKVAIIGIVAWSAIRKDLPALVGLSGLDFVGVVGTGAHLVFMLGIRLAIVLLILALLDLGYQKFQMYQDLRMTREEVREELKRMEGDPIMRQRRRSVARQLAQHRMAQAVPKADVVVTNPTHYAIALKYDHQQMPAPKVVARGADFMAKRIREIALEHNVPVIERKPLAQALYKGCQVGDYVPPNLYKAVAEVLAYVFELAGKGFRRSVG